MSAPGVCRRTKTALKLDVEINHIVIPASDQHATAELLAYILGLEVEGDSDQFVCMRASNGLTLDVFELTPSHGLLQCAFLVSRAEFDAALSRLNSGAINFYAAFDRKGRGEINRVHDGLGIYFDDPAAHLFQLITPLDG